MNEPERNVARMQQILEERARALAEASEGEVKDESLDLLVIGIGKEKLGVRINQISEILPFKTVSYIPGISAWWAGLINLRSNLVPLLDLREYLGLSALPNNEDKRGSMLRRSNSGLRSQKSIESSLEIVILDNGSYQLGLLVDCIFNIRKIFKKEINSPLRKSEMVNINVVEGVTTDLVTILNMGQLFADSRLIIQGMIN